MMPLTPKAALSSSLRGLTPAPTPAQLTARRGTGGETPCAPGNARTSSAGSTPPAASAVGDFSEDILIIARIERLMLLTDAHKARRRHASTKGIMRRLRDVTARLASIGA